MAWTTFQIWARVGADDFQEKVVCGDLRARAQGPLSLSGGIVSFGGRASSVQEREAWWKGSGTGQPWEGWLSRVKTSWAGDWDAVRTRYTVRKGCGSLTGG